MFPSYMTITSDDPTEVEEERRLCYVGITRAQENLTLTCARRRMVRGETQYNKVSRFLREVPVGLLNSGRVSEQVRFTPPMQEAYRKAQQTFEAKPFQMTADIFDKPKPAKSFGVNASATLDYEVGDRVRSLKYGEGLVTAITEGGRDYEITVEFDSGSVRKMFAKFAQLQKV